MEEGGQVMTMKNRRSRIMRRFLRAVDDLSISLLTLTLAVGVRMRQGRFSPGLGIILVFDNDWL